MQAYDVYEEIKEVDEVFSEDAEVMPIAPNFKINEDVVKQ